MSNIAISPLARMLNKINTIKEKAPYYLATSVMVVGSTFGPMNAANAAAVALANGVVSSVTQINEATDTLTMAASATTHEIQLDGGDITAASMAQGTDGAMV